MSIEDDINICTLRISYGIGNTLQDVDYLTQSLKSSLEQIRSAA
jgi:selenocysteine lyase/cysteine desulfurase